MPRSVEQNAAMFKSWIVVNQSLVDNELQITAAHISQCAWQFDRLHSKLVNRHIRVYVSVQSLISKHFLV